MGNKKLTVLPMDHKSLAETALLPPPMENAISLQCKIYYIDMIL